MNLKEQLEKLLRKKITIFYCGGILFDGFYYESNYKEINNLLFNYLDKKVAYCKQDTRTLTYLIRLEK